MQKRFITLSLLFLITITLFSQEALVIADLHFNPFYPIYRITYSEDKKEDQEKKNLYNKRELSDEEKEYIDQLIELGLERGKILNESTLDAFYDRWKTFLKEEREKLGPDIGNLPIGENTDVRLFESMLKDIKDKGREKDFVLFMGDFFSHGFDDINNNRPIVSYILNEYKGEISGDEALIKLKYSTMVYQLQGIRKSVGPDKPIYITLGNSDMYRRDKKGTKVNYTSDYIGLFKKDIKKVFNYFSNSQIKKSAPLNHWLGFTGAYDVDIEGLNITLISLNTNYFSGKNKNSKESDRQKLIAKIENEITERSDNKIWIIMHIPPGKEVPIYSEKPGWSNPVDYWHSSATTDFVELYRSYQESIEFSLTGHTHKSEYKLYLAQDSTTDAVGFTLINPGVGLRSGNYPGYTILDRSSRELKWDVYSVDTGSDSGMYEWRLSSRGLLSRDSRNKIEEIKWSNLLSPEREKQTNGEMLIYPLKPKPEPVRPLFDLWWAIYNLGSPKDEGKTKVLTAIFNSIILGELKDKKEEEINIATTLDSIKEEYTAPEKILVPIQYWDGSRLPYSPAK